MNRITVGMCVLLMVAVSTDYTAQKSPEQAAGASDPKAAHPITDVHLEYLSAPPQFNEQELLVIRRTREAMSHYYSNPNDFYVTGVTIGLDSIWVYVAPLQDLRASYHLYFKSEGPETGMWVTRADDSFRPLSFEFNKRYKLLKCRNNWGECKPIW
jgi:hypothetical protein